MDRPVRSARTLPLKLLLPLLCCTALAFAVSAQAEEARLGVTDFPTSATPAAQEHFLQGLLALHSFEYEDAREAFRRAREVEPGFALATWGEAMTFNHPLWHEEDLASARRALEELGATPEERAAKAPTAREKAYLEAVEVLYGEGDKAARDRGYAEAMARLAAAWPEDLDAAAFHALALLGTCHDGRDTATYMRAAAIVEEVFAENPRHPGAAHYLIHSYDDPVHAPLGLRAARAYADVAPAAVHALHMPSHVFLALGMWHETAASNLASYRAGEARRERRGLGVGERGYHAMLWLHYAYLQLGREREALELLDLITADDRQGGGDATRYHFALMRAAHAVDAGELGEVPPGPDLADVPLTAAASDLFATGYAAVRRGDLEAARQALADLRARNPAAGEVLTQCHAASGYSRFGAVDTVPAKVMELELDAAIRFAAGDAEGATKLLDEATVAEEGQSFGFGPPVPAKPSHELYGEVLLAQGRPDLARERFNQALARAPRRVASLRGLLEASQQLGDAETAQRTAELLAEIRSGADASVETAGTELAGTELAGTELAGTGAATP